MKVKYRAFVTAVGVCIITSWETMNKIHFAVATVVLY